MTHKQKPESAEFRTRAEERAATRTRQEQKEALIRHLQAGGATEMGGCGAKWVADRHIAEAEARGAAEQRRKDAEGVEPVAWVDPEDVNPENTWCNGDGRGFRILEHSSVPTSTATIPLYTRPANITALEARVKELDGEVERRIAEAVTAERERCAQIIENHYEVTYEIGGNGLMPRKRGYISGLSYAAAIREGGEHG